MDKIPVLDLGADIKANRAAYLKAFEEVLDSGAFINGPMVKKFEQAFCEFFQTPHAVGLNSGTDALVIGLRALGVGAGDEVITTPFTFFATAEAISLLGARPVFCDIDPETFNLDPGKLEAQVTDKTKCVIPVHLFGHACDMDAIKKVTSTRDIKILEDNAQSASGKYQDQFLGTIGDAGTFSFFPSKNLGAFGDGGMIVTNDEQVAHHCRALRSHGSLKKYYNEEVGYNSRLDSVQAAILLQKLPRLLEASAGRRRAAGRYVEMLGELPDVVTPVEKAYATHVYHQYTIRVPAEKRDAIKQSLGDQGVQSMIYYPVPLHKLPMYIDEYGNQPLPESEKAAAEVLSLPIWPEIEASTQERVVSALKKAL